MSCFYSTSIGWHKPVQPPGRCNTATPNYFIIKTNNSIIWQWYLSRKRIGTIPFGLFDTYGLRICPIQAFMRCLSIHEFFGRHKTHLWKRLQKSHWFGLPALPWKLERVGAFYQKLWPLQQVLHASYCLLTCRCQQCMCHGYLDSISYKEKMGSEFDPFSW